MSVDHTGRMVVGVILIVSLVSAVFIIVGFNTILSGIETTSTTTVPTSTNTTLPTTFPTTTTTQTTTVPTTLPIPNGTLVDHDPISISSDADFASQAASEEWPGTGTYSDPYIIEGLRIEGSRTSIFIGATTVHYIIRNCILLPDDDLLTWGIYSYSRNARIQNCHINADVGVDFIGSSNCRVIDCTIYGSWIGVNVSYSDTFRVMNNQVFNCQYGIWIDKSDNVVVKGNKLEYNAVGIEISSSNNGECSSNNVFRNDYGIHLIGRTMPLQDQTRNWTLVNNDVRNNEYVGIFLDEETYSTIVFYNKIGYNSQSNAQDNGTENSWDDGFSVGNSWSDYGGTGEYHIPGSAGSVDHYPSILDDTPYVSHDAIEIDGNEDFATQASQNGWPGDGTEATPYVIEGLMIEAEYCVRILHVTDYFEIRNCMLKSTSSLWGGGVDLVHTDNGLIDSCIFYDSVWGVNLFSVESCTVFNCTFYGNEFALNVSYYSTLTTIELNQFYNNTVVMLVDNCEYLTIRDNSIYQNEYTVDIWYSSHSYFGQNSVEGNVYGVDFGGSCQNWTISYNDFIYNSENGISLGASCSFFSIHHNNIGWNGAGNAVDDGSSNIWDNAVSTGNAWSDYGGSGTYTIPGTAGSVDNYPSLLES